MPSSDSDRAIEAAGRLTEGMAVLSGDIADLRSYGRTNRHLIWALCALAIVVIGLGTWVGFLAVSANSAATQARTTCEASNQARKVSTDLWTYVLDLAGKAPQTSEQRQQADDFRQYIATAFAPRSC